MRVKRITVLTNPFGPDTVKLHTDLPDPAYCHYDLVLEFEIQGSGRYYASKFWKTVPIELVPKNPIRLFPRGNPIVDLTQLNPLVQNREVFFTIKDEDIPSVHFLVGRHDDCKLLT